jgi:hypothetical protein
MCEKFPTLSIHGGNLGDVLQGAAIGGVQGALSCALHGFEPASFGFNSESALHVAGHGVVGGASNAAMGGKFQDGFISAAVSAAAADAGAFRRIQGTGAGAVASRTALAGIIGGTASALGGGKFANGAWTSAFQHLLNAESSRQGARLTYFVKERILTFFNPHNGDSAVFQMDSGAGDYRNGGSPNGGPSLEEYPDMTNKTEYEGFKALGQSGPGGPIPRGDYRITGNGPKAGFESYALYPQDESPGDLSIRVKNPITGTWNNRGDFLIHLGTPGGVGCIVTPAKYYGRGPGAPIYQRFVQYMNNVQRSGGTYGYLTVKGSMYD